MLLVYLNFIWINLICKIIKFKVTFSPLDAIRLQIMVNRGLFPNPSQLNRDPSYGGCWTNAFWPATRDPSIKVRLYSIKAVTGVHVSTVVCEHTSWFAVSVLWRQSDPFPRQWNTSVHRLPQLWMPGKKHLPLFTLGEAGKLILAYN